MPWNWELPNWPAFEHNPQALVHLERQFLLAVGSASASLKMIPKTDRKRFIVEMLTMEGQESARIEGEALDRESLQSSIQQHFGLPTERSRKGDKESRMAKLLCNVYETFDTPLTHQMLWQWHATLFSGSSHISDTGTYRTHKEPMQIVSNRYDSPLVFFEAPPSSKVPREMEVFIQWFNSWSPSDSILARAAIVHVYFESIHPFEDGNGRIGRVLAEKALSQGVGRPTLIAISRFLEARKKEYYAALERCNRTLDVQAWVEFFASIILEAHKESVEWLHFLIAKGKMLSTFELNPRQTKALLCMFAEGPSGFKGGLSAEKYIAITKASRATATRDLVDLVAKGVLVKTGELRHTRYWLKP